MNRNEEQEKAEMVKLLNHMFDKLNMGYGAKVMDDPDEGVGVCIKTDHGLNAIPFMYAIPETIKVPRIGTDLELPGWVVYVEDYHPGTRNTPPEVDLKELGERTTLTYAARLAISKLFEEGLESHFIEYEQHVAHTPD